VRRDELLEGTETTSVGLDGLGTVIPKSKFLHKDLGQPFLLPKHVSTSWSAKKLREGFGASEGYTPRTYCGIASMSMSGKCLKPEIAGVLFCILETLPAICASKRVMTELTQSSSTSANLYHAESRNVLQFPVGGVMQCSSSVD
jgi:hypothetical protein